MTTPYNRRPRELATLLNPAFCSLLLYEASKGAASEGQEGLPFLLSFLVLPTTLHRSTRESLPKAISKRMHTWLEENPEVLIDFPDRMKSLVPYTREGLIYACAGNFLSLDDKHYFRPNNRRISGLDWDKETEASEIRKRSRFIGRWLSHGGDNATILAMWGVTP